MSYSENKILITASRPNIHQICTYRKYDHINYAGGPAGIFALPIILVYNSIIYTFFKNPFISNIQYYHTIMFECQTEKNME